MPDRCKHCDKILDENHVGLCPRCGQTQIIELEVTDGLVGGDYLGARFKQEGYRKFFVDMIERLKKSGDPTLPKGVIEKRRIDKTEEPPMYHQVVTDFATGKTTHEEHEPLAEHRGHESCKGASGEE